MVARTAYAPLNDRPTDSFHSRPFHLKIDDLLLEIKTTKHLKVDRAYL